MLFRSFLPAIHVQNPLQELLELLQIGDAVQDRLGVRGQRGPELPRAKQADVFARLIQPPFFAAFFAAFFFAIMIYLLLLEIRTRGSMVW